MLEEPAVAARVHAVPVAAAAEHGVVKLTGFVERTAVGREREIRQLREDQRTAGS